MGFTAIFAITHLLIRHRQPASAVEQRDVEKALEQAGQPEPENGADARHGDVSLSDEEIEEEDRQEDEVEDADEQRHDLGEGAEAEEEEGDGAIDEDTGARPKSTKTPRSRRLRPYYTFGSTASGTTFTRTLTMTTPSSLRHWWDRFKSYVLPKDAPPAEIEQYVPTYRYSPIISGVLIPFSILLEIPGLTEHWYVMTENNQEVQSRPNPPILNAGMGISIACAVLANICLITRFSERWIKPSTLLCVMFLTIHDGITITAVTVFGVVHSSDDGFTYGQAFWLTLCSTIASTITNVNLIIDYFRVRDFAHSGSGLTRKQRSLVILVIILLMYLALGALINSELLSISYINGLYFSTVCIETIGFGDIVPYSAGARVFVCGYIACGMIILGVVISITRDTVLEGLEVGYRQRLRTIRARRKEARRFRQWQARWKDAVEWRLREKGEPVWIPDKQWRREQGGVRFVGLEAKAAGAESVSWMRRFLNFTGLRDLPPTDPSVRPTKHVAGHPRGMHLNINALSHEQLEAAALEAGVPLDQFVDVSPAHQIASGGRRPAGAGPLPDGGWPSQVRTPTDAQIGRISAALTKMALAISGRDVSLPGPSIDDQMVAQNAVIEEHDDRIHEERRQQEESHSNEKSGALHILGKPTLPPRWAHAVKDWTITPINKLKADLADEEKNANLVKLFVAWTVFLLFWFVGSAIFSATEGWTYGVAMYFCFISFTTAGFGDFAPETPAGRSVFVVWALFGVGTLTILVAVLEDAGSSRYKDAMHSRAFDKAVARYRKKAALQSAKVPRAEYDLQRAANAGQMMVENGTAQDPDPDPSALKDTASRLADAQSAAQRALEELPGEIIHRARTFHDYMRFFAGGSGLDDCDLPGEGSQTNVPAELKKLLDEIVKAEGVGDRVKREILQDDDAKHTLYLLSIERALRKMIRSAERALEALADRDALMALLQEQATRTAADSIRTENSKVNGVSIPEDTARKDPGSLSDLRSSHSNLGSAHAEDSSSDSVTPPSSPSSSPAQARTKQ